MAGLGWVDRLVKIVVLLKERSETKCVEGTRGEGGKGAEGKIRNKMRGGNRMKDQNKGGVRDSPRPDMRKSIKNDQNRSKIITFDRF